MFRAALLSHTAALALTVATSSNALANTQIFVLSDAYPEAIAKSVGGQVASAMMALEPGDTLTLFDGPAQSEIFSLTMPSDERGAILQRSSGHKKKFIKPAAQALKAHLVAAVSMHAQVPVDVPSMQVAVPDVLDQLRYVASDAPEVVFVGSPRIHDPRAVEFSMATGYPNDAHFSLEPGLSPYGQPSGGAALSGMNIHFCSTDEQWVKQPTHRNGVERALSLLVAQHGAELATFSPNLPHCFDRAARGDDSNAKVFQIDPNVTDPSMIDASLALIAPETSKPAQLRKIADLPISDASKIALIDDVNRGAVVMQTVWLYDTDSEDGDRVAIVSGNVSYEVALRKQQQKVTVPVTRGELHIVGVADGSGGITVGIRTEADDRLRTPVMQVGERISIAFAKK
ncbi:MAG: hypothetical protein QNI90_18930 [Dinoroseobacter sp.]|nr:hypothetical protein [Dinoroseobacter sp.]